MVNAKDILHRIYTIKDCRSFSDISYALNLIFENCKTHKVDLFEFPSVANRVRGLCHLYHKSKRYRLQADIDFSKESDSHHDKIMEYCNNVFIPKAKKVITSLKDLLHGVYRAKDCSDFSDISCSLNLIFENCKPTK